MARSKTSTPGPSGQTLALPIAAVALLVVGIVVLVVTGSWVAFGAAVALMLGGMAGLLRYVGGLSWTRPSRTGLPAGVLEAPEPSVEDDAHEDILLEDLPLDSAAHREVGRRIREAEDRLHGGRHSSVRTLKP